MIKDRMTLALSVDTQYLKTTVDAKNESDETLAAYAVGFIPWEMVEQSTLFNWARYNVKYTRYTAASITPADSPYSDDTQLKANKGIPFMYAVSPSTVLQFRALYKNPETGVFESAGDGYKSGTKYDTANTDTKNILHSVDLADIVTNNRNATPYMQAQFTSIAILFDNDTYDFSGTWMHRPVPVNYDPVADKIDDITFSYNVSGVQFSRTVTDEDFKTWGKMGYSGTIETGGHKYAIFDYCNGLYCVNALPVTGNTSAYVNGFIAANFPYRYTSTIGLHNTYDFPASGNFPGFIQGYNSFYNSTGVFTSYSATPIDMDAFVNNDTVPSIDVTLTNDDREDITESYYRYKTAMAFSVLMKSYTAIDLKIMSLISTPIVKVDGNYYCPEYNDDFSLTGEWIPYTNQTLNPDDNNFDPDDIPEPGGDDDDTMDQFSGDNILFNIGNFGVTNGFITHWVMTRAQVSNFGTYVWQNLLDFDTTDPDNPTPLAGVWENLKVATKTYFTTGSIDPASLMELIVGLRFYPFDLEDESTASSDNCIYFGTGKFGVPVRPGGSNTRTLNNMAFKLGSTSIVLPASADFWYKDFRDYEGSTAFIYLPFCGTYQIPISEIVPNTQFDINYEVDLATGSCTAYVSAVHGSGSSSGAKTYPIIVANGQCGFEVPLSATNANRLNATIIADAQKVVGAIAGPVHEAAGKVMSGVTAVATGGGSLNFSGGDDLDVGGAAATALGGPVAGVGNLVGDTALKAGGNLVNVASGMATRSGCAIPLLQGGRGWSALGNPLKPYLQIRRGRYMYAKGYEHSQGKPENRQHSVSSIKGFFQCDNVDMSGVSATSTEISMIKRMLETGVYHK